METVLFPAKTGAETAPIFLLLGEDEGEARAIGDRLRELTERPFSLAALPVEDWDRDLSPWPGKAVFKGSADFGGGGDAALERISRELLPRIRGELGAAEAPAYLAGYSLAGLLAAYALFRLPELSGAVCCSGSLWFPGFIEYTQERDLAGAPGYVYLSLGDKEKRSRNPVLSRVEDCTLALRDMLEARGVECVYVSEPGNHFTDPEGRVARGLARCLEREGK